ncbi:hypothetical protein N7462_001257 [Penicillium macrosclerotiorum]|uniref:uncharacterized protein n=1 Tax=Penicillium macrosclerotiorum TaxID=303699 RepID=UPI0025470D00|nr:uncharacterized protein N7462_001257 [Penicillium macrosclerotiorum]KAJ5691834.1 hypothetical protein N7462_001257 [Penicillium macrosclerotiorum]
MARATTVVKSHPAPATDAISFPVLTYTDALPRDDLHDLPGASPRPVPEQTSATRFNFPRPQIANKHAEVKQPPAMTATFDFRLTAPPDEVVPTSANAKRSPGGIPRVGIALGSPSMLDSRDDLPPPRFNQEIFAPQQTEQPPQTRKPSKWKKIGGLFRAKNALTSPTEQLKEGQAKGLPAKSKQAEGTKRQAERRESTEEWPKIEVDSTASTTTKSSPQRSRKFSLSGKKAAPKEKPNDKGPRLDVNIPNIQMERYSVMFGNVMNKNQRPSLLARRAKTLDNLRVPDNQDFLAAKLPPVPQRRATSPARSSFTLFPTSQPSKAALVLGTQNFSRGPSPSRGPAPLTRSNTLPVESPSKVSAETPPLYHNNSSVSSFGSPGISNLFNDRSSTPRSSLDKPLPAIKSDVQQVAQPRPSKLALTQTVTASAESQSAKLTKRLATPPETQQIQPSAPSPHQTQKSIQSSSQQTKSPQQVTKTPPRVSKLPVAQAPKPIFQERKSSLQAPKLQTRSSKQQLSQKSKPSTKERSPVQKAHMQPPATLQSSPEASRPVRPNLKIQTQAPAPPRPPMKEKSSSGSSPSTIPSGFNPTKNAVDRIMSPGGFTASPISGISPAESPRMPLVDTVGEAGTEPHDSGIQIPTIEVSTARSISVSRGKRQILVPIGSRVDQFDSNERYVERRALTPQITGVQSRHKHAVSQELQIESV